MKFPLHPTRTTRALILPDIHYPREDKRTMAAVEKYMDSQSWDYLIYLGDVGDFDCISGHNAGKPRLTSGQAIAKDYKYINARLENHARIVGPKTKMIWIKGNHDERPERIVDEFPAYEGQIEVENNVELIKNGRITYLNFWRGNESAELGHATFIHGQYTSEHHAKAHVMAYGCNVFYGHLHDFQQYSKVWRGDNKTIMGQSLGCLCSYNQPYMRGRPNKWQQGFGVFYFQPNGFFNYFPTMIFNHQFIAPDGVIYTG
jgi:predicted phosphodiesterase